MSSVTFCPKTTAEEVADALCEEIRGKNVLITGTSLNGIGFEAARVIAKYANLVIITGYNETRLKLSENAIKESVRNANIRPLSLDLSSLDSVRKAAAGVNAYAEPLHVLINNAAAAVEPFTLTPSGLEIQFATDHVGPFFLTKLLVPKLLSSAGSTHPPYTPRVVFLGSFTHALGSGVDLADVVNPDPAKHNPMGAYMQAKSANMLTASEMARRAEGKIDVFSVNPGLIYTNMLYSEAVQAYLRELDAIHPDGSPNHEKCNFWKTIPQGAATVPIDEQYAHIDASGAYLDDCRIANDKVAAHTSNPSVAEKLWSVTEGIVGEKFEF